MTNNHAAFDETWSKDPILIQFSELPEVEFKKMFGGVAVYQQRGAKKICLVFTGGTSVSGSAVARSVSGSAVARPVSGSAVARPVSASPDEVWRGLQVVTETKHHAELLNAFPHLTLNAVIKKWLHISDDHSDFERTLHGIYALALDRSVLLGVDQKPRKRKSGAATQPFGTKKRAR